VVHQTCCAQARDSAVRNVEKVPFFQSLSRSRRSNGRAERYCNLMPITTSRSSPPGARRRQKLWAYQARQSASSTKRVASSAHPASQARSHRTARTRRCSGGRFRSTREPRLQKAKFDGEENSNAEVPLVRLRGTSYALALHRLNLFEGLKTHYATWSRTLLALGLVSAGPRLPLSPTIPGTLPIPALTTGTGGFSMPASLKRAQRSIQAMQKNQELPPEECGSP
jgi:hypothetical protein